MTSDLGMEGGMEEGLGGGLAVEALPVTALRFLVYVDTCAVDAHLDEGRTFAFTCRRHTDKC